MLINNPKFKEEGYIAEELQPNAQKQLERKCLVISQTIKDGDFTLEEALKAYEVSYEVYADYVTRLLISEFKTRLGDSSKMMDLLLRANVMERLHISLFSGIDDHLSEVTKHFKDLSSRIRKTRAKV